MEIAWKIATVFLGITCVALVCDRRRTHPTSNRKHLLLDSPGSSIDELEVLNAGDGPHLNRYESLKGVEVTTFSSSA